jgi:lipoprotein-anchoring transpeptidase ErfK/SrfK
MSSLRAIAFLLAFLFCYSGVESQPAEISAIAKLQILLDCEGFSPGEIDDYWGMNTQKALAVFQHARDLPASLEPNDETWEALRADERTLLTIYTITAQDTKGPFVDIPSDYMEKAKLPALRYSSVREAIAEKFHIREQFLKELNPDAEFEEGEQIVVPNVLDFRCFGTSNLMNKYFKKTSTKSAVPPGVKLTVSAKGSDIIVWQNNRIIFYAPMTYGGDRDPLPVGRRKVSGIYSRPHYSYNPKLFWDAPPNHRPAMLAPGPNNPVGVVWIAINERHVGLHGTADPSMIGYAQSHGCIRMTNWDALRLASLVRTGTEVDFE